MVCCCVVVCVVWCACVWCAVCVVRHAEQKAWKKTCVGPNTLSCVDSKRPGVHVDVLLVHKGTF